MKYILLLVLPFLCAGISAQESDSLSAKKEKKEYLVLVNVTNPLLFGKAGAAFTIRTSRYDYFIYSNYIYAPGFLKSTFYFFDEQYASPEGKSSDFTKSGFDIGFQFRFRSPLFSKAYSEYIKDVKETAAFYYGFSFEFSMINGKRFSIYEPYDLMLEVKNIEPKIGVVFGWNFSGEHLVLDVNLGLSMGLSFMYHLDLQSYNTTVLEGRETAFFIKYDIGMLVGYKF